MRRLIIAANRLPFSVKESHKGLTYHPSPGGMAAALNPVREHYDASWIGWAGLDRPFTAKELSDLKLPAYAHAVDLPAQAYDDYYHRVANGTLWPTLHGMAPERLYRLSDWQSSLLVNQHFADTIAAQAGPDDVIWIHDFHLMMLPGMVRKAGITNHISFFLHVPFANPDLFKKVPHWREMLQSLAQVDFCDVQTPRDKTNLLACYATSDITPPVVETVPVGIDYPAFAEASATPHKAAIAQQTKGKTVALSVSRLDYTKGILQQLQAIDRLQTKTPRPDVVYKLIVSPSREGLSEYRTLKKQIDATVKAINKRHPGAIDYGYRTVGFDELTAWYDRADIMVVTPIIDGMNLVAKEYVAARQAPGVLILSHTAGAAYQLTDALLVDPTNVADIQAALETALAMPAAERKRRHEALRQNAQQEDVLNWARGCLGALEQTPSPVLTSASTARQLSTS